MSVCGVVGEAKTNKENQTVALKPISCSPEKVQNSNQEMKLVVSPQSSNNTL